GTCLSMTLFLAAALAGCDTTPATKSTPALDAEARQHVDVMASEALQVMTLLGGNGAAATSTSPEFVQLRFDWVERLYEARLLQTPDARNSLLAERAQRTLSIQSAL